MWIKNEQRDTSESEEKFSAVKFELCAWLSSSSSSSLSRKRLEKCLNTMSSMFRSLKKVSDVFEPS